MKPPGWWACIEHGHMWCLEYPMKCAFCGKYLLPWHKRVVARVRMWWWDR